MIRSYVLILPSSLCHEWKWMTCGQRIFCGLTRHTLHWFPYNIQIAQQLKPHDPQQRLDFARQFLARMEVDDMWPENIPITDEAHFTLVPLQDSDCAAAETP